MIALYNYANQNWSIAGDKDDGWATDKGRIYMTHGPWDVIDDFQAPIIGNPYTIWHYHSLEDGSVFVFEDKQGFNDYRLVHSNYKGEVFSKNWDALLREGFIEGQ
jgi:hypothetical protein